MGRTGNSLGVLGFNPVNAVPGCGRGKNPIFFPLLSAGFLGLEAVALTPTRVCEQRAQVPVPGSVSSPQWEGGFSGALAGVVAPDLPLG